MKTINSHPARLVPVSLHRLPHEAFITSHNSAQRSYHYSPAQYKSGSLGMVAADRTFLLQTPILTGLLLWHAQRKAKASLTPQKLTCIGPPVKYKMSHAKSRALTRAGGSLRVFENPIPAQASFPSSRTRTCRMGTGTLPGCTESRPISPRAPLVLRFRAR